MPRGPRTPRLTRPAPANGAAGSSGTASRPFVSRLARTPRLVDLLPHLHQHAIDAAGGRCSLLFEHNPRHSVLPATSGSGLDVLRTDPWVPASAEAGVVADVFRRNVPVLVAELEHRMPDLAGRLGAPAAWLLPLENQGQRVGLVAVGLARAPAAVRASDEVAGVADAFLTALEMCRLRRNDGLHRDLRGLLDEFSLCLSSTLNLTAGLDLFCGGVNRLFGADRTAVWLHERRARHLVVQSSSDAGHVALGARVSVQDPEAPAAIAMRGCRRALGTIVFEGVPIETGGELDLLDRADELGRQLSGAIENMQLLDDVLRSRRELEHTFDSIAHLVAVSDRRGHIVHVNEAFANRVGRSREVLLETSRWRPSSGRRWRRGSANTRPGPCAQPASRPSRATWSIRPFFVTVTDLLDHERERVGTVMVARDLTPQTKLEAEREELRKRLTQSETLAALGQFVAGIAHELNNPLQGVLGHLELLRVTGAFPKQLRREVQTIYREADRAAKIVRNLLVFAGSRRLVRRPVSLNAVLQKVLALRARACRAADIEVVRHYDDRLPRVQSDPLLLHQVFLNMITNAEHAIAAGGRGGPDRGRDLGDAGARAHHRDRARHRCGHPTRRADPHLRAVLHDERSRPGHRARSRDRLRHRPGARWGCRRRQPSWRRSGVHRRVARAGRTGT